MPLSADERRDLGFRLGLVFRPSIPIDKTDLFFGRQSQLRDIVDAINQNGQHVILYGERGVGKTSLANMIVYFARAGQPVSVPHVNCGPTDSFSDIWRLVFSEAISLSKRQKPEFSKALAREIQRFVEGDRPATADAVRQLVLRVSEEAAFVAVLDEFDEIEDAAVRQEMASTIKLFSDRNVPATIVLVGVADNVTGLLSDHRSIERCLVQVKMPRMSRDEIEQIVTKNLKVVGIEVEQAALHEISRISRGLPHYAHLLGLHSARIAVDEGLQILNQEHVTKALKTAIDKAQLSIQEEYHTATASSRRDAQYKQVLTACAMADTDEFGYFPPASVREPLTRIWKKDATVEGFAKHLHEFCKPKRGPILKKSDSPNRPRFRFTNTLMQPFVIMKAIASGLLSDEDLKATRDKNDPQGRLF